MNVLNTHLLHAFARLLPYHEGDDDGDGGDGDGTDDERGAHGLRYHNNDHDGDDDDDDGRSAGAENGWHGACPSWRDSYPKCYVG